MNLFYYTVIQSHNKVVNFPEKFDIQYMQQIMYRYNI